MRKVVVFGLALLSCCAVYSHGPPLYPPGSPADLDSKTVAVVRLADGGPVASCSGVWVGPGAWLTANHCVAGQDLESEVQYVVHGDLVADPARVRTGVLSARDEEYDLALVLAPEAPPHETARVLQGAPRVGQAVQTMGHPMSLWWSYSTGVVSALRWGDTDGRGEVQATAPISPGSSGGGLFDERGVLVGICQGTWRGQNLNVFVHPARIRAFLAVFS